MYYGMNPYGLSPYMYDDPYTTLQYAQDGLEIDPSMASTDPNDPYYEPHPSNYKSYAEFKNSYDNWMRLNSPLTNAQVPSDMTQTVVGAAPVAVAPTYEGPSVVEYLGSTGKSSDYKTRKQIAKVLGIPNYKGTPGQNKLMISLLAQNPGVLNTLSQTMGTMSPTGVVGRRPQGIAPSPTFTEDVEEEEIVNTTGVNIPVVDSSGNVIDTTSGKVLSTLPTGNFLPKSTLDKNKKSKEEEGLSNLEMALAALSATAVVGGAGYAGFLEAKDIISNTYRLTGNNLKVYNDVVKNKMMPKVRGAAKAATNLGAEGRETYNLMEDLYQEGIREARRYKGMGEGERVTYDLLQEQKNIDKATRGQKSMLRTIQNQAPKGTPRLTIPNTPRVKASATTPKVLPKATFSYQNAAQNASKAAANVYNSIRNSAPLQKASGYMDELANTARNIRTSPVFRSASNLFKRFRFQEGGEQQNQMMQQIVGLISQELQQNKSPYEIAQTLMTYGISQDDALKLIDQVTMEMSQYMQPNMAGAPQGDEQGYMAADAGQEAEQQMMMAYGGGYSGTYDQGSGSYFQMGGGFVPTYGDILPQYMYGSGYDDPNMYYNQSYMQDGGSLNIGDTLDVSPEQIEYLRQQGYDFDIV